MGTITQCVDDTLSYLAMNISCMNNKQKNQSLLKCTKVDLRPLRDNHKRPKPEIPEFSYVYGALKLIKPFFTDSHISLGLNLFD